MAMSYASDSAKEAAMLGGAAVLCTRSDVLQMVTLPRLSNAP